MNNKLKNEIADIFDMYADMYWSNEGNNVKITGVITFNGINVNNNSEEYAMATELLINKGLWESEHGLYVENGKVKISNDDFSYQRYKKQLNYYRKIKTGYYNPIELLPKNIIQDLVNMGV